MSLSPIGSAVFELLSRKHTDRQTSYYFIVRISMILYCTNFKGESILIIDNEYLTISISIYIYASSMMIDYKITYICIIFMQKKERIKEKFK